MKLFIPGDYFLHKVIKELKGKNIEVLLMDEFIDLNGKELSIQAYEQIKKRDRNNLHVIEFKRKILEIYIKKIEEANGILLLEVLNPDNLFQISVAYYLHKQIYIWNDLKTPNEYQEIIKAFNPILLKEKLDEIIE